MFKTFHPNFEIEMRHLDKVERIQKGKNMTLVMIKLNGFVTILYIYNHKQSLQEFKTGNLFEG